MKSLIEILKSDCSEYINTLKSCPEGYYLFRGFQEQIDTFRKFNHNMNFRRPVNTPREIHDTINSEFEHEFNWKIRNGVFCYGFNSKNGTPIDLGYGKQYILFPIGKFDFVYSPDHFDIYHFVTSVKIDKNIIAQLTFKNDSLENAINSGKKEDGISNEISVRADSYYLVNPNFISDLDNTIWNFN